MEHPKAVGDRTTLAVMLALQEAGYDIAVPFGENTRYDLLLDDGVSLIRVQCKSGRLRAGAVEFAVCSCYGHHPNPKLTRRDYTGEVDSFAVYCRETGGVYLVPIQDVRTRVSAKLRVDAPRNNQQIGIRWAAQYQVATVELGATRATPALRERPGARGSCA
jgi:hypothetical protein